ncbi:MAG TPA: TetR/AcrR family transcriptional regulator, partial [Acidimicrobiia bacterium]|jgi:AcrR family transcriptional regulator
MRAIRDAELDLRAPGIAGEGEATRRRILDAALVCLARFGVAKTNLDDVAREAGCSRATLYRYFPGKAALVVAAADSEIARIVCLIADAGDRATDLEDAVTDMMLTAARELSSQKALQRVLVQEPALVLQHCAFSGGDRLLALAAAWFAPTFARFVPAERAPAAAEWCTRVLLQFLHLDGCDESVTEESYVRPLVRHFVLPGCVSDLQSSTAQQGDV